MVPDNPRSPRKDFAVYLREALESDPVFLLIAYGNSSGTEFDEGPTNGQEADGTCDDGVLVDFYLESDSPDWSS